MGRAGRKNSSKQGNLRGDDVAPKISEEFARNLEKEEVFSEKDLRQATEGLPLESLPLHLQAIGNFKLLSPEEEIRLARRAGRGDKGARDRLVESNLRLVVAIARRYQGHGVELLDLIQDGSIGLMRAADKFDPERKLRFSTYATWWIKQGIMRSIDDKSRTVRIPVHMAEKIHKLRSEENKLASKLGRDPLPRELAGSLEWKVEDVQEVSRLRSQRTVSLDKPLGDEDGRLADLIPDDNQNPIEEVEDRIRAEGIHNLLKSIPDREERVIRMRYGLDGQKPKTLAECGEELQLSRERVRQIEASARKRIALMPEAGSLKGE